ncbi:hypothetical protein [Nonomuraea dietziae]|uniref:hypothetical protein n=1 Tax=Nonomuraea dietziae TaxID=65515 RepID=UPI0031D57FFB
MLAQTRTDPAVHPEGQVPHWLFAYDAAGMTAWRALTLPAVHAGPHDPAHLRAAVLEALRRWPTTPAILRDTTAPTRWRGVTLPEGSIAAVITSFTDEVPFSDGPAACPGEDLALLTATEMLAAILRDREVVALSRRSPLDHFGVRFAVRPRER